MKRILLGFIAGTIAGAFGYWYYDQEATQAQARQARHAATTNFGRLRASVQENVPEIRTEDIRSELERAGMVVREKLSKTGAAISDATADARTTAAIKGKLLKEPGLGSLSISVDTTDGLVTLSGTTRSHEDVTKAVRLALETEGVRKVVSTLQVKSN